MGYNLWTLTRDKKTFERIPEKVNTPRRIRSYLGSQFTGCLIIVPISDILLVSWKLWKHPLKTFIFLMDKCVDLIYFPDIIKPGFGLPPLAIWYTLLLTYFPGSSSLNSLHMRIQKSQTARKWLLPLFPTKIKLSDSLQSIYEIMLKWF